MRKIDCYVWLIGLLLLAAGCRPKETKETPVTQQVVDYPVITINDDYALDNQLPLYDLSEDFVRNLLLSADNYEGTKISIHAALPEAWGLVGIERMSQGRELWLVQSQNREWTYLVITSGSGTQRIVDAVPIGLDLAHEDANTIEREEWNWHRDEDGAFVVEKYYQWKKSIADATSINANDYTRDRPAKDKYIINEMGRFDCYPLLDDSLSYRVVVLYRATTTDLNEWDDKTEYIEAFCEDQHLNYACVTDNYQHVVVRDNLNNEIITLNLTPEISPDSVGMILYENGKPPKHVPFRGIDYLQMEIQKYFKN